MTGRRLLIRSLHVCGNVRYAATKTASVLSEMLPRKWMVPHSPIKPRAQIGSGASLPSPSWLSTPPPRQPGTRPGAFQQFGTGRECVNLTEVFRGNNVSPYYAPLRVPLHGLRRTVLTDGIDGGGCREAASGVSVL